jgi:hypothetical protein
MIYVPGQGPIELKCQLIEKSGIHYDFCGCECAYDWWAAPLGRTPDEV